MSRRSRGYCARVHLRLDEFDEALRTIDLIRQRITVEDWGSVQCRLLEIEAEIALAQGHHDEADQKYTAVMAAAAQHPFMTYDALFQQRWGERLKELDETGRADQHFDHAVEIYERNGFAQRWTDHLLEIRRR